jgi:hypothetical protein
MEKRRELNRQARETGKSTKTDGWMDGRGSEELALRRQDSLACAFVGGDPYHD